MAYALRNLFLHSKYFKHSAGGMLASFTCVQNSYYNSFIIFTIKDSVIKLIPRTFCSYDDFKSLRQGCRRTSHFEQICLPGINMSNTITEGQLLSALLRITKVYSKALNYRNFEENFKQFLCRRDFKEFSRMLENKLPYISPSGLIKLYEYIDSGLISEQIAKKICVVILETINNFGVLEKLHLYIRVLEKRSNLMESNNVKKVCETYFEECFEREISHVGFYKELLDLLDLEVLPRAVRKVIAQKCLNDLHTKNCDHIRQIQIIQRLISLKNDLVPKNELKEKIRNSVNEFYSGPLLLKFILMYNKHFENEDYLDIEGIEQIVTKCIPMLSTVRDPGYFVWNICLLGYLDDHLLNIVVDMLLPKSIFESKVKEVNFLLDVIVRSSFQDTHPEEEVEKVRRLFASYNDFKSYSFQELCRFCENLTYLGFDTRSICNYIFEKVTQDFESNISERNVLLLHHLAKACLSSGYTVLSEKILDKMLQLEFEKAGALPTENLNEYFGSENCVLKNCTTSDKHCLHFVAIFGPDNKPIDLSIYKKKSKSHNKCLNIDEIEKPEGYKMIVFQKFLDRQPIKFYNQPLLSGAAKKYLKIFDNLHCSTILLPYSFFISTPEKKEEFLSLRIKDAIDTVEMKAQQI